MFIAQVFWVIGIHGNQMVKPIREPLLLAAIAVNTEAFEAGKEVPNIITMPFWDMLYEYGRVWGHDRSTDSSIASGKARRYETNHQVISCSWDLQHQ